MKSGQAESVIVKGWEEESTFSAVPSSRRSNKHDAVIIAALLRCHVDQGMCIVEQIIPDQCIHQYHS